MGLEWVSKGVFFRLMVRTKFQVFSLLQNCSERNSELFLSSGEWLRTEFRAFSVPWNRRNSDGMNQNFRSVLRINFFFQKMATLTSVLATISWFVRVLEKNFLCLSAVCPSMAFRVPPVALSLFAHIFHASAQPITNIVRQIIKNITTNRTTLRSRFPTSLVRSRENEPVAEIISHIFILFRS